MWFMSFSKANCKNCYACIRTCFVHAIKVKEEQAHIIKERCIICGKCFKACPQNAKLIKSEVSMIKHYNKMGKTVVASLAPSFSAIYGKNSLKIPTALKKLGFNYVKETVEVTDLVLDEYIKYANKENDDVYITSFCPSINNLIQKHYPELTKNIIPVTSPSILHGRILKEKYPDSKVVFIGPCLSKKTDAHDEKSINSVITFEELDKWFKEENIDLESLEDGEFKYIEKEKRMLPIIGSITDKIKSQKPKRTIIQVDGVRECIEVLDEIKKGKFKNTLFEMTACRHGCIGGSGMLEDNNSVYEKKENIKEFSKYLDENKSLIIENDTSKNKNINISIYKEFPAKDYKLKQPSENELKEILKDMGKYDKSDELNCGGCGYHSCREKAIAVYNNMAEINMCLPFMREKAENLTSTIFEMTPNMIAVVNKELEIARLNPAAEHFFNMSSNKAKNIPIGMFLEEEKFKNVKTSKKNIYKERIILKESNSTIIQSIIWLDKNQVLLWIGDDITEDEKLKNKIKSMKIDAVNMAQDVIDKQMIVAQEIASLLGETTAQTKVTLTNLKQLIKEEENL
ncbi:[Fe-Fe] hydrogenase large subunit C-terminal domain-containing protein [Romboutsia sp. 1001216sp1]|uniref:[Fe-Fe] hydrogenase large subunit C-terminal domain-containing protein n=2 Tax=Romboutsia sp. 1001216sp1 TaxID=2986997 RepID=UPI00232CDFE8|nr:[Fe-Fe] hydrogenase large subunit C-terminal domain-containing protein [Romboutsia sp. 1001216sp1]MDB8803515.1 [Fe-Fe] hydrogenase large subunit C-terminal domain-containing protein [Romboutsia sp. 1001216sp1]MDB8808455.1 [Fe-Fe] hydrogenase large subunit C-terminal domain-containing protein [Romboutsia sp. 1001216sp1]MDB8809163.1 [Fe-Fe] hydrogenase large subunit C-terminal domain-containing protein [Romboutsia sp. 1001216sp1]MDB8819644.1 [Fe-Fe] hydrogenase large subunit C-terminal domain-